MKPPALPYLLIASFILLVAAMGCRLGGLIQETGENTPAAGLTLQAPPTTPTAASADLPEASPAAPGTPAATPSPAAADLPPTLSPTPADLPPTLSPTPALPCSAEVCTETGFFLLGRPVGPSGRYIIDPSSRFGDFQRRSRNAHYGVDFLNSSGTPVLAAADGVVVVAGDDSRTPYALIPNTYGNLVILRHEFPGLSQPVFTVYAHLSQVSVKVDDTLQAGQEIGLVGMSGSVRGSTLHFEVRYGENTYQAVRNPELWLAPLPDETGQPQGALAGRVLDSQGNYLQVRNILVERLAGPGQPALDQIYLKTYSEKRLMGLVPWEENFAVSDLPAGSYQISFWLHGLQQRVVEVLPSMLTRVTFVVE